MKEFDYVVIGGGSAGCLVAARLSEKPENSVLLIEAGKRDSSPLVRIPSFSWKVLERNSITYEAEAAEAVGNRPLFVKQARLLGGGSSMNGMVYTRGNAADYDHWSQLGNDGWSFENVLPVFRDLENNDTHHNAYHGSQGPLRVSNPRHVHPLARMFIAAAEEAGIPRNSDFNGVNQTGCGLFQTTTWGGERWSSARAFLRDAERRNNLAVFTEAEVTRLIFKDRRVTGIVYSQAGQTFEVKVKREAVLTAGALATPKILLASGVGPAEDLRALGIPVIHNLPGVGANLQDHLMVPVIAEICEPMSLAGEDRPLRAAGHALKYLFGRRGLLSSNLIESGAFARVGNGKEVDMPDAVFAVLPAILGDAGKPPSSDYHGLTICPQVLRPESRGSVKLRSAQPEDPVELRHPGLEAPYDVAVSNAAVRMAIKILNAPSLARVLKAVVSPQPHQAASDDELTAYSRETCSTVYHVSGTAKMGPNHDTGAVVNSQLSVHGLEGVRVCDASIMPTVVSGNTNAPTIMIAERGARFMMHDR
jgi:choline dehydrogenase-like flavoprotein